MEEYEEGAAGIHVASQTSSLKYGLWINTTKNPRLKAVEFAQLGISIEVTGCFKNTTLGGGGGCCCVRLGAWGPMSNATAAPPLEGRGSDRHLTMHVVGCSP